MEVLKRQRAALKGQVTRIGTFCESPNPPLAQTKVRQTRLEQHMRDFERVQGEIEALSEDIGEISEDAQYRVEFENAFYTTHAKLSEMIANCSDARTDGESDINKSLKALVDNQCSLNDLVKSMIDTPRRSIMISKQESFSRLPEVKLPEFSGKFDEWVRFRDLFNAIVGSKDNLSGVEKLEYLQTRLRGDAASIVKHVPLSNENFTVAWDLLKSHYDKPQFTMIAHLDNIFDQPVIKQGSLAELKHLFSTTTENINALRSLNLPVDSWGTLLIYVLVKKLDSDNKVLWVRKIKDIAKFSDFSEFLKERVNELESLQVSRAGRVNLATRSTPRESEKRVLSATIPSCFKCKQRHLLYQCSQFRDLAVHTRCEFVKNHNICPNCLRSKHNIAECKFSNCKECGLKHNTLLHSDNKVLNPIHPSTSNASRGLNVNSTQLYREYFTLLPTAIVHIKNKGNEFLPCRALLDSGSQATLISEACLQRLGLKRSHVKIPIVGVGQSGSNQGTRGQVKLEIKSSIDTTLIIPVEAFVLSTLTKDLPGTTIPYERISYFNNLPLADSECYRSKQIDVLLGADVFFDCLAEGRVVHPLGSPVAKNTIFGWVIAGNIFSRANGSLSVFHSAMDLDTLLRQFFEPEGFEDGSTISNEVSNIIEEHFQSTHTINSDGRFVVRLPFNKTPIEFGDSRGTALKFLYAMERRFAKNPGLKNEYVDFMREYERLGHMAPVSRLDLHRQSFYLPHHAVIKPSSVTTKLRVVFNASCKSTNGFSLNDYLLVGPTIQNNLFTCTIKFRKHRIAVKADIAKMYRQVLVNSVDAHFQRILWREEVTESPRDYVLQTVTYGTASASFLATRVLKQIGINNGPKFPKASEILINDFYVDDLTSSFESVEEALLIKNDLNLILQNAGMDLRKWSSNSADLVNTIDAEHREIASELSINAGGVKTLGLLWDTKSDIFKFSVSISTIGPQVTKREVLSQIARIFDPLGWLSPVSVKMKVFIKRLWVKGVDWDEYIPSEFYKEWSDFLTDLRALQTLSIPRWFQSNYTELVELHGFADASESAYAAAVYFRVVDGKRVRISLVCAKSRNAPAKPTLSIPRLELCGCLLLTKLLTRVKEALGIHDVACFAYTDSTTVLYWIQGYPRNRNVFVDNRISQIASQFPTSIWHYVRSAENPADCATRGLMPRYLQGLELWWNGPSFLRNESIRFREIPGYNISPNECKSVVCLTNPVRAIEPDICSRFSNLYRLYRVIARCICLLKRHRNRSITPRVYYLSPLDIHDAKIALVRLMQSHYFEDEIKCLSSGKAVSSKSKYARMNPFIDQAGALRVGGRLENANIPFEQKHPLILHKDHHLTWLIVRDCHLTNLHAGMRQMTYLLSLSYFIIGIHHVIKRCIFQCTTCIRQRAVPYQQQMASLPKQRLEIGIVFGNTGVDYAGPFLARSWKGRGAKQYKVYIALFLCMATKAMHLELVSELSSSAFIAALRRFVARRGKCHTIFSDNGTNFVGANHQLREWANLLKSDKFQDDVSCELTARGIAWSFIPPHGPHFGGLWEAGVKTVKFHLRRVLGQPCLTFEEFSTILCQIEACANSRPLCSQFEGCRDPLTPAHFLIARPYASVPEPELLSTRVSLLDRWQYIQRLHQDFWRKWSQDYLTQLQKRPKWLKKCKDIQPDDIVVLIEDNQPPCRWLTGKITRTYPGRDGLTRVATVLTANGEVKRPISKLCPLLTNGS